MKIIFAIIQDEDVHDVMAALAEESFQSTKISSTGGFLRSGNSTLFIGTEKGKVDDIIEIIKSKAKSRKKVIPTSNSYASFSVPPLVNAMEVVVGGATIFVIDVERLEKC